MIAAYFLIVFWFIPLQIVMAVMARRIASGKGFERTGDAFLSTLFFGYPAFVAVCEAPSQAANPLFARPLAGKLLEFVSILVGTAWSMLAVLLISFALPGQLGDSVGQWALGSLAVWALLSCIAIPLVTMWLRKQSKHHGPVTWKSYAIAILGQVIAMLVLFSDFTIGEEGLTDKENAILRNLILPCAVPLVLVSVLSLVMTNVLALTGLIQHFTTGIQDSPNILYGISAIAAIFAASAVSPLICYDMAQRKRKSTTLWTAFGFVLPVLAPLALAMAKTADQEQDSQDDWLSAMLIQSQVGFAIMIVTWWVAAAGTKVPKALLPWFFAAITTWMCFSLATPFVATYVLKHLPKGASPMRLAVRSAGIHSVSMTVAMLLTFIKSWLHSALL